MFQKFYGALTQQRRAPSRASQQAKLMAHMANKRARPDETGMDYSAFDFDPHAAAAASAAALAGVPNPLLAPGKDDYVPTNPQMQQAHLFRYVREKGELGRHAVANERQVLKMLIGASGLLDWSGC